MHLVLASDPDWLHYVPELLLRLQLRLTRSPSKRMLLVGRKLVRDIAFGIQHPERVKPTAEGWDGPGSSGPLEGRSGPSTKKMRNRWTSGAGYGIVLAAQRRRDTQRAGGCNTGQAPGGSTLRHSLGHLERSARTGGALSPQAQTARSGSAPPGQGAGPASVVHTL
jgi:hypothetical protein